MNDRILTLLSPTAAQTRPVFRVRRDLCGRLVAHLEHRGFRLAGAPAAGPEHSSVTEVALAPGTPLGFLATAKATFLAQVLR